MSYILLLLTALSSLNSDFTIKKIYDDKIFYNFVSYENELYVSSNEGVFRVNPSGEDLTIYDKSITGPINSIFQKNNNFKIKFTDKSPIAYPELYVKSITDFAFLENDLFVIARGKLLIYSNLTYSFKSIGSVRSINDNSVGTYGGVYINGNKLEKITYTDGQIKEFDSITFVCYNGLLSFKDNIETKLYNNDNSIRTKGEYGAISNIFEIGNSNYLLISDKGLFNYDYNSNNFKLIYTASKKIIPLRNKIESRIKDRGEFHFIDDKKYISINVNSNIIEIIDGNIGFEINDILESDINGNDFYAISNNNLLLSLKRTTEGLSLSKKIPIINTAHTISDYDNLIFLSGNNGLSVFEKTKEKIINSYIVDEFNSNAVYKEKNKISFGSIHGVYSIDNVLDFERNLIFKDYKINSQKPYLYFVALIFIFILIIIIKKLNKKHISDDQLISNIKRFINKNLSIVTLKMLESEFNLDYNDINSINKNFKPAKYIKILRLELTKKMLLNGKSISEVSSRTGYSETYLLKNKYKFMNK
ncbi:MAG: hypothetical protein OR998_05950 [Flavobacteriaceae bacterium]|nr:hypothetical protein [Flavobacteriaceae bacterium]